MQRVVGNPTLLLWLRRRDVNPSLRSSRAPMLLLPPYPINQATAMNVREPSAVLCARKCISVYGCVSQHYVVVLCAHQQQTRPIFTMFGFIERFTN